MTQRHRWQLNRIHSIVTLGYSLSADPSYQYIEGETSGRARMLIDPYGTHSGTALFTAPSI